MKFLRIILFPFAILYDLATRFRNYLFNIGYKQSFEFETCVIAVGNLAVGGTGKSPMVEYILRKFSRKFKMTTLSRGYGRKTKGFRLASKADSYLTIGDEPMQFYKKFNEIHVAVGEERSVAIPFILAERPETKIIVLDDAYQHRYVKPNFNILLTSFDKPFYQDFLLPAGRLREARQGAQRADAVVVTKCPKHVDDSLMQKTEKAIRKYTQAPIFFTSIKYLEPMPLFKTSAFNKNIFLFTGIAHHEQIKQFVQQHYTLVGEMHFSDHHRYQPQDIDKLLVEFNKLSIKDKCLLTTEKDMVKLMSPEIEEKLKAHDIFYLPIETYFLQNGKQFDELLEKTIKSNLY